MFIVSKYQVGIAIATHNAEEIIGRCLFNLKDKGYLVVIFDDASIDKTLDVVESIIPDATILEGDGSSWWGGGTAQAVDKCFSMGCDFVLMLNPDSIITVDGIEHLIECASKEPYLISAAIVAREDDKEKVFWGGSRRLKIPGVPIYTNKYILRSNTYISEVNTKPYDTDEVHGRGVLLSRLVYEKIGTLDWNEFPHYGADNDYSMRAKTAGIKLKIVPSAVVYLLVENSGMDLKSLPFSINRVLEIYKFLTSRKNGEYISVLWRLNRRHTPFIAILPSFVFNLAYVILRKLKKQ